MSVPRLRPPPPVCLRLHVASPLGVRVSSVSYKGQPWGLGPPPVQEGLWPPDLHHHLLQSPCFQYGSIYRHQGWGRGCLSLGISPTYGPLPPGRAPHGHSQGHRLQPGSLEGRDAAARSGRSPHTCVGCPRPRRGLVSDGDYCRTSGGSNLEDTLISQIEPQPPGR